jgi:hypothetical protein
MTMRPIGHRAAGLVVVLTAAGLGTAAVGQELGEQAKRQIRAVYADNAVWKWVV